MAKKPIGENDYHFFTLRYFLGPELNWKFHRSVHCHNSSKQVPSFHKAKDPVF